MSMSRTRIFTLLRMAGMDPTLTLGKYDLGSQRPLSAYEHFIGMSLARQVAIGDPNRACGELELVPSDRSRAERELAETTPKESSRSANRWMDHSVSDKMACVSQKLLESEGLDGFTDLCHFEGHKSLSECEKLLVNGNCGALTYKHETCFLHDLTEGSDFRTETTANSIVMFRSCEMDVEGWRQVNSQGATFESAARLSLSVIVMLTIPPYLFFYASQPYARHLLPQSPLYAFN